MKAKTTTKTKAAAAPRKRAAKKAAPVRHVTARPSMGDPDREQDLPGDQNLPDLDNETVHKTARPTAPLLEDDDMNDELAEEHQTDRDEDVSEGNPLHVGHYIGR